MILVLASIAVAPDRALAFHQALAQQFARFRAEDGCMAYRVAVEDAAAGRLIAVEKWRDRAAMDAHNAGAELAAAVAPYAGAFEAEIEVLELPDA